MKFYNQIVFYKKPEYFNISYDGLELLKRFEGVKLKAYLDTGGVWTIGVGHTKNVKKGDTATEEQVNEYLREDIKVAEDIIKKHVKVALTQQMFDALTSFAFNIGETQFRTSTLLKLLNEKQYELAANEFKRWKYDNGEIISGLVNRRAKEKELFLS